MSFDRRTLLLGSLGVAAATPLRAARAREPLTPARLARDVARYAGFGIHQTGSSGDLATGAWIAERLRDCGFTVTAMPVEVPFFDARAARLRFGGVAIDGFAQHPVTPTGPGGFSARLAMRYDPADDQALAGAIAVIVLPYGRHSSAMSPTILPLLLAVKRAGARAAILGTTGPTGQPIALNASPDAPFAPLPVLNIGTDQLPALIAAARAGASATLVIDGIAGRRRGANTIGRRPGHGPKVVVTTPLSGWFTCAGERGSGVAAWLAAADWLPRAFPHHDLTFAGMVGHELENMGSKLFLADTAPPPDQVVLWQHIGSGLATRDQHEAGPGLLTPLPSADAQRWLVASPPLMPLVAPAVAGLAGLERVYPAERATAAGEATAILGHGYTHVLANFAGSRFHHVATDGPETTSGELIAAAARGLRSAVTAILRQA